MPFNGSGTFNRLFSWAVDAANNVNISSSRTDAELNGMAAALTNCVTRDGQSPPSANLPMGGLRITNLGAAAAGTDALNMATGDARYVLTSILPLPVADGGTGTTTSTGTGSIVLSNAPALVGPVTVTGGVTASGSSSFGDTTATRGDGTGVVFLGTAGGSRFLYWDGTAYNLPGAPLLITTASPGDSSTKAATTAYVTTALTSSLAPYAPLASPTFTGTPAAPTAASGTATTQLATTAFVDALRDVPSNAKAANYTLALTDRGGSADFNGTSLTCMIPANGSIAFPVGTVILITNLNSTSLSIAITTDTLTMSGTTTTGTRTLGQNGEARLRKVTSTSWLIAGTALT